MPSVVHAAVRRRTALPGAPPARGDRITLAVIPGRITSVTMRGRDSPGSATPARIISVSTREACAAVNGGAGGVVGSLGIDGDDHHAVYLDEKGHGRFVGCRRQSNGALERGDFVLHRQPGREGCALGTDRNSLGRECAQIRPEVGVDTNFAGFREPRCFEHERRPAIDLEGKNLRWLGRVRSWERFRGGHEIAPSRKTNASQ